MLPILMLRTLVVAFSMGVFLVLWAHVMRVVALADSRPPDIPEARGPGLMDIGRADAVIAVIAGVDGGLLSYVFSGSAGQTVITAFTAMCLSFMLNLMLRPLSRMSRWWNQHLWGDEWWISHAKWAARPMPPWGQASSRYRVTVVTFLTVAALTLLGISALILVEAEVLAWALGIAAAIILLPLGGTASHEIDLFVESGDPTT